MSVQVDSMLSKEDKKKHSDKYKHKSNPADKKKQILD